MARKIHNLIQYSSKYLCTARNDKLGNSRLQVLKFPDLFPVNRTYATRMAVPQRRTPSETVIDNDAMIYINEIANVSPESDPFENASGPEESTCNDSCFKSCAAIKETAAEPESHNSDGNSSIPPGTQEYYCEHRVRKLKMRQKLFLALIVGMAVMLVGTLVGLIIVATGNKPRTKLAGKIPEEPDLLPESSKGRDADPKQAFEFPHFSSTDKNIAGVFADVSIYSTFFGVTYAGPGNSSAVELSESVDEKTDYQRRVTLDVALLSRVAPRIRIAWPNHQISDRVVQAISDLGVHEHLVLSISADEWSDGTKYVRRILNSYSPHHVSSVLIERSGTTHEKDVYMAHETLRKFLARHNLEDEVSLKVVAAQKEQANPIEISVEHPKLATEFVNSDYGHSVYTNLETPSETSEKAKYMTSWVCGVVPHLRSGIEWYWANAFDDESRQIDNGIFTESRELKPAGLPRCQDY